MKKSSLLLSAAVLILASCVNGKGSGYKPGSSGVPYEVLLVSAPANFQNGAIDAVTEVLEDYVPGLPQAESAFKVSKVTENKFSSVLHYCRNIIMVNVDATLSAPKLKYSRDVYAAPQVILTVQAPDAKSLIDYVGQNGETIVGFLTRIEMNRAAETLRKKHSLVIEEKVKNQFGCDIWVPQELVKTKTGKDFFWASTDLGQRDMNFVIYSYPYRDPNTFTEEYFLNKRDSVMKINIPGPREGQYMATARPYVLFSEETVRGKYAQVVRGLWEMENYDMGGPFVSVGRVDEKNQRVVVAEGFVYAPGDQKKDLMRRMEAALYTLMLPDDIDERRFSYNIEEVTIGVD